MEINGVVTWDHHRYLVARASEVVTIGPSPQREFEATYWLTEPGEPPCKIEH